MIKDKELTTVEARIIKNKKLLLEQLKKTPIIQVATEKVGISRATYYRWRKEDKNFAEEAEEAKREGIQLVNDMAESQLLAAIRDRNMTAIIYWLKHHHVDYSTRIEIAGKIRHEHYELTAEQKDLMKKAIRLALPEAEEDNTHEK
ncbi:MAG: phBC6A51 family helix-turn-helix protein [Patescibacteria group bacterium]|nr:phBC6A51 family helix-turn-helix protein [Patescibacteria group bacterium]